MRLKLDDEGHTVMAFRLNLEKTIQLGFSSVISDPEINSEKVLIVNFMTRRADSDSACVLQAGEHPFGRHETCVNYGGAKILSTAQIETLLGNGSLSSHSSLSAPLLERIGAGAAASTRMALEHADILIEQGQMEG